LQIVSSAKASNGHPWLIPAFAISILLHVFLLWSVPDSEPEAGRPASIEASLRSPLPPTASATPAPAVPSQKAATTEARRVISTRPTGMAATDTAIPLTLNSPVRSESPPPQSAPEAHPAASAAQSVTPVATQVAGPTVSADGLRQYRLALAREAGRFKRYPDRAIEAGWSGTAELRVKVAPGLGHPVAELTKSSGHAILDEAALEMMGRALPTTPIPTSLQARVFSVELPIVFELPE
jgi:protein TonB